MNQHAAADELGISPTALAEFESGARKALRLQELALEAWSCASLGKDLRTVFPFIPKEPRT